MFSNFVYFIMLHVERTQLKRKNDLGIVWWHFWWTVPLMMRPVPCHQRPEWPIFYCKSPHPNHLWCITRGLLMASLHGWLGLWSALMLGGASLFPPCSAAACGVPGRCCSHSPTHSLLLPGHSADMSGALNRDEHGEQKSVRGGEWNQISAAATRWSTWFLLHKWSFCWISGSVKELISSRGATTHPRPPESKMVLDLFIRVVDDVAAI